MEWSDEAGAALKKVPFFIRKKVRLRVEDDARKAGKNHVGISDVRLSQKRYLSKMSDEIQGYQIETCFGSSGCPNRARDSDQLVEKLEKILKGADILSLLRERVKGDLRHHHEFRVAVADCPNACSQPQIRDVGIIGGVEPRVTDEPCSFCGACEEVCIDKAIQMMDSKESPEWVQERCMMCGKCVEACPTGTLGMGRAGYRVQLGGKLGRHPRLAEEVPGIFSAEESIGIIEKCLAFYKKNSKQGERFAEIYRNPTDLGLKQNN